MSSQPKNPSPLILELGGFCPAPGWILLLLLLSELEQLYGGFMQLISQVGTGHKGKLASWSPR